MCRNLTIRRAEKRPKGPKTQSPGQRPGNSVWTKSALQGQKPHDKCYCPFVPFCSIVIIFFFR